MAKSYIKLISAMLIWGSIALFVRGIPFSSAEIVSCRIILGAVFLISLWFILGRRLDRDALRRNAPRLIISGVIMGLNWVTLFEAYIYVDVTIATLGYYCAPIFVIIGSILIFKQKPRPRSLISVACAVLGMVIVTGVNMGGSDPARGLMFALASAVFYSIVTLFNKTFDGLDGLDCTICQILAAGVVVIPYALISHSGPWVMPNAAGIICIIVLGFVHTGMALYFYFSAIKELPSETVALCSYIDPVSAIIFASIFLNERLSPMQIAGAALIIGSALWGEMSGKKKKA